MERPKCTAGPSTSHYERTKFYVALSFSFPLMTLHPPKDTVILWMPFSRFSCCLKKYLCKTNKHTEMPTWLACAARDKYFYLSIFLLVKWTLMFCACTVLNLTALLADPNAPENMIFLSLIFESKKYMHAICEAKNISLGSLSMEMLPFFF
jgi:hypothetical protein